MSGNRPMGRGDQSWDVHSIQHGWDVVGADGDKVGDVDHVEPNYLVVSKGWLFPTERYIPFSAVSDVRDDRVYLNVTKDEIDARGWDNPPKEGVYETLDHDRTTTGTRATAATTDAGEMTRARDLGTETTRDMGAETIDVPITEEELQVRKRAVESGSVHVSKDVVEEQRTIDVPLREEEIHVERRPVDRPLEGDQLPEHAFEERDIDVPVYSEQAEVTKRPVVREEVEIRKEVREREQPFTGKVRREEVHVEGVDDDIPGDLHDTDQAPPRT